MGRFYPPDAGPPSPNSNSLTISPSGRAMESATVAASASTARWAEDHDYNPRRKAGMD